MFSRRIEYQFERRFGTGGKTTKLHPVNTSLRKLSSQLTFYVSIQERQKPRTLDMATWLTGDKSTKYEAAKIVWWTIQTTPPHLLRSWGSWLLLLHLVSLIWISGLVWMQPLFVEYAWDQATISLNASQSRTCKRSLVRETRTIISGVDFNAWATKSIQQKKVTEVVGSTGPKTGDVNFGTIGWWYNLQKVFLGFYYPSQYEERISYRSTTFQQEVYAKKLNKHRFWQASPI